MDEHAKLLTATDDLGREPVYQELRRSTDLADTRPAPSGWKRLTVPTVVMSHHSSASEAMLAATHTAPSTITESTHTDAGRARRARKSDARADRQHQAADGDHQRATDSEEPGETRGGKKVGQPGQDHPGCVQGGDVTEPGIYRRAGQRPGAGADDGVIEASGRRRHSPVPGGML
ncbi:hypothetical protein [Streptomyces roseolilacinus]|uniref:hypothetical protein n=1 Tax=Streptomyces roseolilacinus TaxID=66904 RepID=UPI0016731BFE|nr:hypothetical protein [Streptomyces roseolilacinus]